MRVQRLWMHISADYDIIKDNTYAFHHKPCIYITYMLEYFY